MEPREPGEPFADDQQVKITDLPEQSRSRLASFASRVQARYATTLLRRRWLQVVILLALVLLCLALLLRATPGAPLLPAVFSPVTPASTAFQPSINQLYLNNGPGWAHLSVDGRRIVELPIIGQTAPLWLSAGTHQLRWEAAPFPPQSCSISVPASFADNCLASETTHTLNHQPAWVVTFNASLNFMNPDARRGLTAAIAQALAQMQTTELVNAGEHFIDISKNSGPIQTAAQELHATLNLTLDNDENNPCNGGEDFSSCRLNGQNCFALCTRASSSPDTWNVIALVQASWTYTTPHGQVVATNMPDALGGAVFIQHFLPLTLSWDGADWSVQASQEFLNGSGSIPVACASFLDDNTISPGNLFGNSSWQAFAWHYISADNPAAGCLLDLTAFSISSPTSPPGAHMLYLHRFGVTLAVNRLAQSYSPTISHPDAYEQRLVQQIANQAHIPLY